MTDVTLTAAVRQSLLSLQNTTGLIQRTQNRMSTGLKVAGPIDDPVAYFQAKGLSDRSVDFQEKKNNIDQGISAVGAALEGINGVESVVNQLKGIAQSLKTADASQTTSLVSEFNNLRAQIGYLTADANYQGTNLINGTGQTLSVEFSDQASSKLTISSVDATQTGLGVSAVATTAALGALTTGTFLAFNTSPATSQTLSYSTAGGSSLTLTFGGAANKTLAAGEYTIAYGTGNSSLVLNLSSGATLTAGQAYTLTMASVGTDAGATGSATSFTVGLTTTTASPNSAVINESGINYVSAGNSTQVTNVLNSLDVAKASLRTSASTLGTNVALLKTRLDFTTSYTNVLEEGSGKLTLADINEEGANLLALQTRQQLGINALSLAGQAEQSVLSLFR